jgi:hypothetical protein
MSDEKPRESIEAFIDAEEESLRRVYASHQHYKPFAEIRDLLSAYEKLKAECEPLAKLRKADCMYINQLCEERDQLKIELAALKLQQDCDTMANTKSVYRGTHIMELYEKTLAERDALREKLSERGSWPALVAENAKLREEVERLKDRRNHTFCLAEEAGLRSALTEAKAALTDIANCPESEWCSLTAGAALEKLKHTGGGDE